MKKEQLVRERIVNSKQDKQKEVNNMIIAAGR